jgi:hypothetical protein
MGVFLCLTHIHQAWKVEVVSMFNALPHTLRTETIYIRVIFVFDALSHAQHGNHLNVGGFCV